VACSNVDYEKNISIPTGGWHKDSIARFEFEVNDLRFPYEMDVYIRNDNSYPYSNIYLFINVVHPDGAVSRDTAEYDLADAYGKWLGHGWCANFDNNLLVQGNYRFAAKGKYRVEIMQAMRELKLKGIKDVGFSLHKLNVDGQK
jgi:gliding motility-associated lipoprotein GldH